MIYTKDHEPMHVHVWYQGNEAVIRFETETILLEEHGFNGQQIRRAVAIVRQNREFLIDKWREIYG